MNRQQGDRKAGLSRGASSIGELRRRAGRFMHSQCSNFTGMRPVFGDILINFEVVWYSGMRKWYAEC